MPARLSPTRRFQYCALTTSRPYGRSPYVDTESYAMLTVLIKGDAPCSGENSTTTHPKSPCNSKLTHSKVLSQEGSHMSLVWLARLLCLGNGDSPRCSVLVDPGTIPVTPYNHTSQPLCPSLKQFYFSVLDLQINQGTKHHVLDNNGKYMFV